MGSSLEEVIMSFECRCVDFEVTLRHLGWVRWGGGGGVVEGVGVGGGGGGGNVKQVVGCRGLDI